MRQYPRRSSSVARQNQGIKQTRTRKQCASGRRRTDTIFPSNLTLAGSEFHIVGVATKKPRVPAVGFILGM